MKITLNVVLTPDEMKNGVLSLARGAAVGVIANPAMLDTANCTTDIQATAASTFIFDLTPKSPVAAAPTVATTADAAKA